MNYHTILKEIKAVLTEAGFRTVTYGDLDEVDLQRQNLFPLAHIICENATVGEQPFAYSFSIIAMDAVTDTKEELKEQTEPFHGIDNTQDVQADLHYRLAQAAEAFRRGESFADGYQLSGAVELIPFTERFEALVAGWIMPLNIISRNYTNVC